MKYRIRKYNLVYIDFILSVIGVILTIYYAVRSNIGVSINYITWLATTGFFLIFAVIHELSHYVIASLFNGEASIRFFPRLGALLLDYASLQFNGYIWTVLAPVIVVQIPLLLVYLVTGNPYLLLMNIFHLVASLVDLSGLGFSLIKHYGGRFYLVYDEKCKVVGVLVEESEKGIATFYQL